MLEKYVRYINAYENTLLNKYFEEQKSYIHCKEGCSFCCETGQYPYSQVEFEYLKQGIAKLSDYEKVMLKNKIKKVKKAQRKFEGEEFLYECPLLLDKKCCVYEYRGFICRTFGLIYYFMDDEGVICRRFPACVGIGLNYSNVYNPETKSISSQKWKESGIEAEPIAYNLSREAVTNNSVVKDLGLEFGELRALIDWFE